MVTYISDDSICLNCKHCFVQNYKLKTKDGKIIETQKATCYGDGYLSFPIENDDECDGYEDREDDSE